jgi:predicted DNA-binding protein with PD1-like motif
MKSFKTNYGYLLCLDRGEEIVSSVISFVEKNNVRTGLINAIGALTDCVLGYYDKEKKGYISRNFNDTYELVSMIGNITFHDEKPVIHVHVSLGDSHCNVFGGHLFSGTVAVTAEIFIMEMDLRINRALDEELNLNLIDSEENA